MRFQDAYQKLVKRKCYIFSFGDLCAFYPEENRGRLAQYLSRWKTNGWISRLRKGLYELTFPERNHVPDFFMANKIYAPSYVSLETALSYYSLIPEVSMAVVSVSPKTTRQFKNTQGLFIYRSIRPEAFRGYVIEKNNGFDVLIAEPEKAVIDYLYFKTLRGGEFDMTAERLDKKRLARLNQKKLKSYAEIYQLNLKEVFDA